MGGEFQVQPGTIDGAEGTEPPTTDICAASMGFVRRMQATVGERKEGLIVAAAKLQIAALPVVHLATHEVTGSTAKADGALLLTATPGMLALAGWVAHSVRGMRKTQR